MPKPRKNFTKRTKPSFTEQALGVGGATRNLSSQALDYFTNMLARTGFNAPGLFQGSDYELIRFSYDYWQLITLYRNHWISRRIVDTPAIDMIRAWPRLTSDIDPEDITRVDRAVRRTGTKAALQTSITWARLFGGAGALIVIDGQEKELDRPLDLDSVPLGGYKGLCPFDRWAGIMPDGEICTDPSRPLDFNKPDFYRVTAVGGDAYRVHSSRILRFLGPEVPTPEREAQTWWGISVLEPIYEDMKKYDNLSWNILMLTYRANIMGMKFDNLAQLLSGVGSSQKASQGFEERMSAINHLMSNQSLIPLPKDGGIESTQYTFSGLDTIFQLFQLAISGGSQIPVSRLWGRTYSGLGAPEDVDEKLYEEKVSADQSSGLVPQLEQLYPVICMSELGEVPEDLDLVCPSIRVMDEKDKAELATTLVNTVTVALNSGIIPKRTAAMELKQGSKQTDIMSNISDEFIASLPDTVQDEGEVGEGLFGEEGGGAEGGGVPNLTPASSAQKVLREEGREKKAQEHEDAQAQRDSALSSQIERARHDVRQMAADADGAGPERLVHGLRVVVETPRGFPRHGVDAATGRPWETRMPADYGYIRGHKGADGDSLDAYLGPDPSSGWVYVIDQSAIGNRKKFDESKVMLGFPSQDAALRAYDKGHHRSRDIMLDFTPMAMDDFKKWLIDRDPKKPCSAMVTAR